VFLLTCVVVTQDSDVCLTAANFFTYEISYLVLALQRLVREAQGRRDMTNWEVRRTDCQ